MNQSTLYIVSTPIGNLADLSIRAKEILEAVDFIVCEDTRVTKKLLLHFGIHKNCFALNKFNEFGKSSQFVNSLLQSPHQKCALVSDAGTPCISDPGSFLVKECHEKGIQVISVPGPVSFVAAVAASGFQFSKLIFSGFFPKQLSEKTALITNWSHITPCLVVFFESPHRILKTLQYLQEVYGNSLEASVSREITKIYEENRRATIAEHIAFFENPEKRKGEFVIVLNIESKENNRENSLDLKKELEIFYAKNNEKSLKKIAQEFAVKHSVAKKTIYSMLLMLKNKKDIES